MDIMEQFDSLKADYEAANALLTELNAKLSQKETSLADLQNKLSEVTTSLESEKQTKETFERQVSEKIAELEEVAAKVAELEANQQSAEQKAIALVASQGIPTPKVDASQEHGAAMTKAEAIAAYEAIKDPIERGRFYLANKAMLVG